MKNRSYRQAAIVSAIAAFFFAASSGALACSRLVEFSPDELFVADLIVRATAEKYVKEPGDMRTTGMPDSEVEFKIDEVLRGANVPTTILLNGYLSDKNDFNDVPFPYTFVRRNGRSGSCFANTYKKGGQFLLFLKKLESGGYTSNISALGPSNEQIKGAEDSWVIWTKLQLAERDKK